MQYDNNLQSDLHYLPSNARRDPSWQDIASSESIQKEQKLNPPRFSRSQVASCTLTTMPLSLRTVLPCGEATKLLTLRMLPLLSCLMVLLVLDDTSDFPNSRDLDTETGKRKAPRSFVSLLSEPSIPVDV